MANRRGSPGETVPLIEDQTISGTLRQPPSEAADMGGAREVAVRVTAAEFTTSTTTTTVELFHGFRNRTADMELLRTFVLTSASPTSYTYVTQYSRYLWSKVSQDPAANSSRVEMLSVPKS